MESLPAPEDTSRLSSSGVSLVIVCAVFIVPTIAAVGLRLWARRIQKVSLCFNDHAIVLALLFEIAFTVVLIIAVVDGKVGYHIGSLTTDQIVILTKTYFASEPLWVSANSCIKLSILHLYVRIFSVQKFRYAVYAVAALVVAYWASTFIRMFFLCSPFAFSWDKTIPNGRCIDVAAAYLSATIINLILDVMVIILPMPVLWRLQMPTGKKVGISAIFSIGAVICVIIIFRIIYVVHLDLNDLSYSIVEDCIFSNLEPCLGIINATLPTLRPALSKIFGGKGFTWTRRTGSPRTSLTAQALYPTKSGHTTLKTTRQSASTKPSTASTDEEDDLYDYLGGNNNTTSPIQQQHHAQIEAISMMPVSLKGTSSISSCDMDVKEDGADGLKDAVEGTSGDDDLEAGSRQRDDNRSGGGASSPGNSGIIRVTTGWNVWRD
ncbi:hypothetical protein GJ744_003386 [Endocarpon pusillum]|uniref:Rhodopsin domain-containing protein n=1 Tax=Endocarpon pusillum TaxID=364733 RepID=A0A8H7A9N9_9EURO|nr:hypothetical protein GJ744_003386 [Endocarpon pusillum]